MPKLSSYGQVTSINSGELIPLFRSGVNNYYITPSSLISGSFGFSSNSGKLLATNGAGITFVNSNGMSVPGSNTQIIYNSGGFFGASTSLTYDGLNFSVTGSGRFDWIRANSGISPATTNSVNIGSASTTFGSGYFKAIYADNLVVNSSASGRVNGMGYGWAFPSGVVSGTGTNVSYELTAIAPGTIRYGSIRSKTLPSGADFIIDINKNGTSIWTSTQANRLKMTNNTSRSGSQTSFDTIDVALGDVFTLDLDQIASGVYANDIVVSFLVDGVTT